MSKKMVIVVTAVGVRKVVEKWLCENMTCELVVSRNARHECCVEVIYDSGNPVSYTHLTLPTSDLV